MRILVLTSWFAIVFVATILGLELTYGKHEGMSQSSENSGDSITIPIPVSTSTPRPTRKLTLTPTLVLSTPSSTSAILDTTQELRLFMLDLINTDRISNGLEPVKLGGNLAAQLHAEELFRNGFLGHWGLDGLKPYMRYTLAGGTGAEGENVSGSNEPRLPGVRYAKTPIRDSLREAQEGLMSSPGHRQNILDPWHQRVNLGIACDDVSCTVAQQFEHNYIQWNRVPSMEGGLLAFGGRMLGGFAYSSTDVWYDPLPKPLQANQIRATYCYSLDTPVVFIREPAPPGSFYPTNITSFSWSSCLDPRDVNPTAPPPQVKAALPKVGLVPWADPDTYKIQGTAFDVVVDMSPYLAQYGDGVYTVVIWGDQANESVALTNYSIFVR